MSIIIVGALKTTNKRLIKLRTRYKYKNGHNLLAITKTGKINKTENDHWRATFGYFDLSRFLKIKLSIVQIN